jgi:hypothetical protein
MNNFIDNGLKVFGFVALVISPFAYTTGAYLMLSDKIATLSKEVGENTGELRRIAEKGSASAIQPAVDSHKDLHFNGGTLPQDIPR